MAARVRTKLTRRKCELTKNSYKAVSLPNSRSSVQLQLTGDGARSMDMTVWEWFEQRSFHHGDFHSLAVSGTRVNRPTVTLIFPARNVAGTIGTILSVVDDLRARTGLLDQVIVIDADSPDGTADVARAHGAEVYSENELMRAYGPAQGKGDAMWRALSVARGDIVMFADADTDDFEEHFVYGTLGPLLAEPRLPFVKAAFPPAV